MNIPLNQQGLPNPILKETTGVSLYDAVQTRRKRLPRLGLLAVTSTFVAS